MEEEREVGRRSEVGRGLSFLFFEQLRFPRFGSFLRELIRLGCCVLIAGNCLMK